MGVGYILIKITLGNQKNDGPVRRVVYDVLSRNFFLEDGQALPRDYFLENVTFHHPLLEESYTQSDDFIYSYQYDDIEGLFHSAIYVYSTLFWADDPLKCHFKISPSSLFQRSQAPETILISLGLQKPAKFSITISKLNDVISLLYNRDFQFSNDVIIDSEFTINNLPSEVDGDALYKMTWEIVQLLKSPPGAEYYELRFIDPVVGYGVFAHQLIKKGTCVGVYTGIKRNHRTNNLNYAFAVKSDLLNMYIDACQFGNLTRFINHAPSMDDFIHEPAKDHFLLANIGTPRYYLNGIDILIYKATRDIQPGEQLLVDYGKNFFKNLEFIRFKPNGKVFGNWEGRIKLLMKKTSFMRAMADLGVKEAQSYLLIRYIIIFISIFFVMGLFKNLLL